MYTQYIELKIKHVIRENLNKLKFTKIIKLKVKNKMLRIT